MADQLWCVQITLKAEGGKGNLPAMFLAYNKADGSQVCVWDTKRAATAAAKRYRKRSGDKYRYAVNPVSKEL